MPPRLQRRHVEHNGKKHKTRQRDTTLDALASYLHATTQLILGMHPSAQRPRPLEMRGTPACFSVLAPHVGRHVRCRPSHFATMCNYSLRSGSLVGLLII